MNAAVTSRRQRLISAARRSVHSVWLGVWVVLGWALGGGGFAGLFDTLLAALMMIIIFMNAMLVSVLIGLPVGLILSLVMRRNSEMPQRISQTLMVGMALVWAPFLWAEDPSGLDMASFLANPYVEWLAVAAWASSLVWMNPVISWLACETPRAPTTPVAPPAPEPHWSPDRIRGFRSWSWTGSALKGMRVEWVRAELSARCDLRHRAPEWSCRCGIYAMKADGPVRMAGSIDGEVEMWGRVIEHSDGYRAEHARIVRLVAPPHLVPALRDTYPTVEIEEK